MAKMSAACSFDSNTKPLVKLLMTLMRSGDAYVASSRLFGGSLGLMRRLEGRYATVGFEPRE
jgi:O-acetylhomoserine (thiol)-lyase